MSENFPEKKRVSAAAIPIKQDTLRSARIELRELPVVQFQNNEVKSEPVLEAFPNVKKESRDERRAPILTSAPAPALTMAEAKSSSRTPAFIQPPAQQGSTLNRKALESTNRGKSPSSRRFVRGILHPSPFKVATAAFFAIAVRFALVGAVILGALILLNLVDLRLAWGLLLLPVAALLNFATVGNARCRVCGVKEFIPSGSNKHVKTHRFLLLGPIVSTALHLLLFKWFHCMFCGTAIRIKK